MLCVGARGTLLRWVRVDPQGWSVAVAALRRGTPTRNVSHTREKGLCHHMHHSTYTESALRSCVLTRATHTRHATARVASLANNPRRHVQSVASAAQRRAAQRAHATHARQAPSARTSTRVVHSRAVLSRVPRCVVVHTMWVLLVCVGLFPGFRPAVPAPVWELRWCSAWLLCSVRCHGPGGFLCGSSIRDVSLCGTAPLLARWWALTTAMCAVLDGLLGSADEWRPLRGVCMFPDARRVRGQRRHPREYYFGGLDRSSARSSCSFSRPFSQAQGG